MLENKFSKVSNSKNIDNLSGNFKKIKYSNVNIVGKDQILQRIEQMFINHLGNNYLRELIYSHYGTWLPKYGFYTEIKEMNPNNLTKFSVENLKILDGYIISGDWVKYFEYKNSIRGSGELNFVKKYIYLRSLYIPKGQYGNMWDY